METLQLLTFSGVAILVVLESFKLLMAINRGRDSAEQRAALESLLETLEEEENETRVTKSEYNIGNKKKTKEK